MENRAFNMDCMEAMRSMPDQCFDLAVVDPPYGIKISNNMGRRKGERPSEYKKVTWDDAPPPPEYFTELVRVSKNQIIFGANHFVSLIPAADSSCWICWDKGFSSEVSFASFELAWTSFDRPSKRVALSSAQAGRIHPTQKPVALYAWIFQHYAKPRGPDPGHTPGERVKPDRRVGRRPGLHRVRDRPGVFRGPGKAVPATHRANVPVWRGGYLITIYIFRKMKATCAWC